MPRQIAYDTVKLQNDLMTLFWAKGFSETSLADLEAASGLNRRQLYNGIGDKRQMFLQALDSFAELSGQTLLAPLEQETAGLREIEELFAKFAEMAQQPVEPKGCLICNTSLDEVAHDPDVAKRINAFFDRIRTAHLNALTRAADRGEITLSPGECEKHADALYGAHVALCVLGRARRPEAQLRTIAEQAVEKIK